MFYVIANANARKIKKNIIDIKKIEKSIQNCGKLFLTKNIDELQNVIKQAKNEDVKLIAIIGGDGSQQKVMTYIIKTFRENNLPLILPLKGGTMNMLVNDIGNKKKPEFLLHKLSNLLINQNLSYNNIPYIIKNALYVKWKDENNQLREEIGFYFTQGIVYDIMCDYYKRPASAFNGIRVTTKALVKALANLFYRNDFYKAKDYEITINNEIKNISIQSLMISTIKKLAFGFNPLKLGKNKNDYTKIDLVLYKLRPRHIAFYFVKLLNGNVCNLIKNDFINMYTIENISIKSDNNFILDGERYKMPIDKKIFIENYSKLKFVVI